MSLLRGPFVEWVGYCVDVVRHMSLYFGEVVMDDVGKSEDEDGAVAQRREAISAAAAAAVCWYTMLTSKENAKSHGPAISLPCYY